MSGTAREKTLLVFDRVRRGVLLSSLLVCVSAGAACRREAEQEGRTPSGLVVINAPATGEVRRVLVVEGADVSEGATVVEIAVAEAPAGRGRAEDPVERARTAVRGARGDVAAAEAEVARASVEVQRVEPLVAAGAAPQAQLDAARAQFQQAQERLTRLRETARSAQDYFVAQEGGALAPAAPGPPPERLVPVRVPAAGEVRAISVRPGQRVTTGQPLATVSVAR
jgi:multidrug resistance efflux pump